MDSFEMKFETRAGSCDKHGEFVEKGSTLPFGKGRTIWYGCPQCNEQKRADEAAEATRRDEQERQQRMEKRLNLAGIPLRFRDRSIANFVADTAEKRRAAEIATGFVEQWPEHDARGTTVIFAGKPGTGKSHLAIAMAMALMSRTTSLYINAMDLVRMVRDTWRRGSDRSETEVLDALGSVGLLIIDEIGVQYGTDGEQVILFDVINRRYRDARPMILLTNQNKKGMAEFLGERAFDRLREGGIWVTFDWDSYRAMSRAAAGEPELVTEAPARRSRGVEG